MKKAGKSGLTVLIVVIAATIIISGLNILEQVNSVKTTPKSAVHKTEIKKIFRNNKDNYIAKVKISGIIQEANRNYNQDWILSTIKELKNDSKNLGIALFIESPGGTIYETDEVYLALQDYKTTGKKVYAYQAKIAASGGYYISCAANKIYANRNTMTGSIGVISGQSLDLTGLFDKLGIKMTTIHSGRNKNMFSYNEPLTEEQKKIMQSISDEAYEQFTGIVAISRNIILNDVKKLADGRIYTAKQALENGLIDAVDSWDNMIKDMKEKEFEGKDLQIQEFTYEKEFGMSDLFYAKVPALCETIESIHSLSSELRLNYPAYLYR